MTRRRWRRWTLGIVGGLVLVILLAVILLPLLVPRDRLRDLAEDQIRERTGGEVALGELGLQVFPRLQLVLGASSLAVTDAGLADAGLQPGPLVAADVELERLAVDLALWPLLRRELEFGNVTVESPRIQLVTTPPVPAGADDSADPGDPAAGPEREQAAPAFGLYLASVAVRDGHLAWQEQGTGRQATVSGWEQDLSAPDLGVLVGRLARLSGAGAPADDLAGPAVLELDTRVRSIELAGLGSQPLPPLADLRLRARLEVPPAADLARFQVHQLTLPPWGLTARGEATAQHLRLAELSLRGGEETVRLEGRGQMVLPPAAGPLQLDLAGDLALGDLLGLVEPYLPPRAADDPPLPQLSGELQVTLQADVPELPSLADAAGLQEAWQAGLPGRVDLQVTGGPMGATLPQLDDPLQVASLNLASDLSRAGGRTRLSVDGLDHPAVRGEASAQFVLPPASGPLSASSTLKVDLARLMTLAAPYLPPRPQDAPPLPEFTGIVDVILDAELTSVPALTDTTAWATAWEQGLPGRADLRVHGGPLDVVVPQLGPPLTVATLDLRGDLTAAAGRSRLELRGVDHPILQGDAVAEVVPANEAGAVQVRLELPRLDLDALSELARQAQAAADQQARAIDPGAASRGPGLVRAAHAADPPPGGRPGGGPPLAVGELIPADLAADLSGTVSSLVFLKTGYTDVQLQGTLRERVIEVPDLRARLGSGTVRGRATVDYASDPAGHASWEATVDRAPARALLAPYVPVLAEIWSGDLSAQVTGDCELADPEAILSSLTLAGDLTGSDGIIDLRQKLGDVRQYLGQRQDLLRVVYDGARQHVEVKDGKVVIEGLRIDGKDTDWTGEGTVSLDGTLDLDLHVRLPAGFTPDLGDASFVADALRDEEGRIGLDFSLTGPSTDPVVSLDLDPQQLMQSDAIQDRLQEEAKKGLGGLLDRLKGR